MSLFRDIGQAVGNILMPSGKPILNIPVVPGISQGTATQASRRAGADGATVFPGDDFEPNPGKTLPSTFGFTKPSGGPPYENVLEQFASYSPLWTLCCLEPNQFNNPITIEAILAHWKI